jgi:hypothetical protein
MSTPIELDALGYPIDQDRFPPEDWGITPEPLEVLTPLFLYDVGMGGAIHGITLAQNLAEVTAEYGPLTADQFQSIIDGHTDGSKQHEEYVRDLAAQADSPPPDLSDVPF